MDELFMLFNANFAGRARLAVVGGEIRKMMAAYLGWNFPDRLSVSHLDAIIDIPSLKQWKIVEEIFIYFNTRQVSDMCRQAELVSSKLEIIGVMTEKGIYSINKEKLPPRPDLTIERFGYYNDWSIYDESGRGWEDFLSGKLSLMNDNLFLQKYLKILSLQFQTGFVFDEHTARRIDLFEKNLESPEGQSAVDFPYNKYLFDSYSSYAPDDRYKVGIHVALLYLRARDVGEVTRYIENHRLLCQLLKSAGVDYAKFEQQIRERIF